MARSLPARRGYSGSLLPNATGQQFSQYMLSLSSNRWRDRVESITWISITLPKMKPFGPTSAPG